MSRIKIKVFQLTYHGRRSDKLGAGIHGWKLEREKEREGGVI